MRELERIFVRVNWLGLTTIALGFALWEVLLRAGFAQYQNLPAPSAIADGLVEITTSGQLLADTLHTLRAVLVGWAAALVLGVVMGLLLGASSTLRRYSLASIEILRPMPGIAFAPVALLLFGFSLQMELMVIILPALWPVLINTMGAVLGVHARLFEVGRTFRLSRGEIILAQWRERCLRFAFSAIAKSAPSTAKNATPVSGICSDQQRIVRLPNTNNK